MAERFPDALDAFHADPVEHHLPGGEHPVRGRRALRRGCLRRLRPEHDPDGRVLVVAHSTAHPAHAVPAARHPLEAYRRLFPFLRNCALTEVRSTATQVALLGLNQVVAVPRRPHVTEPSPPPARGGP